MYRLFLALRYLRTRLVNLVSIGGVMMGVAVLIVVVSIMDGFQAKVRKTVRGNLSHLIMTPTRPEMPPFADVEQRVLRTDERIVAVAPQIQYPVAYQYTSTRMGVINIEGRNLHQMTAIGIDWEREKEVSEIRDHLMVGDPQRPFFNQRAHDREKGTVLVGRRFAEQFLLRQPKDFEQLIGQDISILFVTMQENSTTGEPKINSNSRNLIITGVVDAQDSTMDVAMLWFDLSWLRKVTGIQHPYIEVRVKLSDYEHARAVQGVLTGAFPGFVTDTWEDQRAGFLQAVNSEKVLLVIVLSFIVLLGGFIILATLTLTVVEKTKDIGILGALGASSPGILSVFVWNGLLIGVIGSVLGLGLGALFTDNVDGVREAIKSVTGRDVFPANVYHFRKIPVVWDWPSVLSIMAGSMLVAFLAGLVPALRAARLDPIKALRYE